MSWRWLYVVPFALGMVVAVDRIVDIRKGIATRTGLIVMALLLFVFASPSWVVSRANRTTVSVPSYKLDNPTQLFVRLYSPTSNGFGLLHVRKETHLEGLWIVSPVTGGRYCIEDMLSAARRLSHLMALRFDVAPDPFRETRPPRHASASPRAARIRFVDDDAEAGPRAPCRPNGGLDLGRIDRLARRDGSFDEGPEPLHTGVERDVVEHHHLRTERRY